MMRLADNIPGKPHRWADAIGAWARGELVQWRYASTEATDADWRDCDYPSRGMPNWSYPGIEYRAALSSHHEDGGRAATMVLVPREPTPEMIDALVHQKNLEGGDRWVCRNSSAVAIYKAAVNAFNEKEPRHG